jgi:hypothetical protein
LREHEPWLKTQKPFRLERNGASFNTKTPARGVVKIALT